MHYCVKENKLNNTELFCTVQIWVMSIESKDNQRPEISLKPFVLYSY
ncbi:hypothetical protein HMPREF9138_01297 [Prevotella histicola F0411]|uniref:Uncharacterized protein n=1 Tax=Prevotella histicola F0411 TaxID=857291 RepID=G6AGV1_9BACT|nr:hypothetical protein HMPREF9138_01297 [Prevotella histicola F0411]